MKASRTNREKAALIEWQLKKATEPFGYQLGPSMASTSEQSWCFVRAGDNFKTEMICVELRARPKRMSVDLFGSMHTPEYLAEHGLTRNAGGFNLHQYQVQRLDRDQDEVLPIEFELGREEEWQDVFGRLATEIAGVHPRIWSDLWDAWNAAVTAQTGRT